MSTTEMTTDNALTVKRQEMEDFVDIYKKTAFGHMQARGSVHHADELTSAKRGDSTTVAFTAILKQIGITESGTMVGNTEAQALSSDTMKINIVRAGVENPGVDSIEQQRTNVNFDKNTRRLLRMWQAVRLDASFFNQLAGVDSTTITIDGTVYSGADRGIVQGLNSITAPSADRVIRPGAAANDQSLTSTDTFSFDLIDAALERVATTNPTMDLLDNDEVDIYIHPSQLVDLKRDTTAKVQWLTTELAQVQGGETSTNGIKDMNIFSMKPIAKYSNANIIVSSRVANGVSSADSSAVTSVKRAVLVGRNAIMFGSPYGGRLSDKDVPFRYATEKVDVGIKEITEARMIYGAKKLVLGGSDYGVITIPTFGALHS